jgi:hypothetical protein
MPRVVADEPNRDMRCGFVWRVGAEREAARSCSLTPPCGGWGWRLSGGAAAAAQLAVVVAAASLLDEWSSNDHPGDPYERNRDKEREGHACAPAPGNRHRDPPREHRGDDHSAPRHDPWKCVLRRCASPVESQTLEASVGAIPTRLSVRIVDRGLPPEVAGRVAECEETRQRERSLDWPLRSLLAPSSRG